MAGVVNGTCTPSGMSGTDGGSAALPSGMVLGTLQGRIQLRPHIPASGSMTSHDEPTQPALPRTPSWSSTQPTLPGAGPGTGSGAAPRSQAGIEQSTAATIAAGSSSGALLTGNSWSGNQPDVLTGQLWGDFLVGPLLGRGGMGAVYRGRQQSLDRDVAIKVLPPHLSDNEGFRSRFQLEAKAVASLDSPHIIKVYGAGEAGGHNYFAMEYVEGDDLSVTVRKGGKPSQRNALEWVLQAARGLQAAGELGIVHRDIKPANMMLTRKGVVKLMDFGLVRSTKEAHGLTMTGTVMGTVSYFSPEQGRGERCDSRTDLYALGVVFYEFLTGRLPFTGEDPTSIIYQHIHVAPTPPREVDPGIPEDFQAVCLKCLQKNAEDRYQLAGELVADLERLGRGDHPDINAAELQRLRHGTTLYIPGKRRSNHRGMTPWIVTAVAIACVGAAAVWLVKPASAAAPSATDPALVSAFPTANPPAKTPVTTTSVANPPLIAPTPAPAIVAVAPITISAPSTWTPKVQEMVAANRFAEARALVAAHADEPGVANLSRAIDQAEGVTSLNRARVALQTGDLSAAATHIEAARTMLGAGSTETIDLAQEVERRSTMVRVLLAEAKTHAVAGRIAEAQVAVTKARKESPTFANLAETEALVQREADRLAQGLAARDAARAAGEQALAAVDLDRADASFAEALRIDATDSGALSGQRASAAKRAALTELAQQVTVAVKAEDLAGARAALKSLTTQAPSLALTTAAQKQVTALAGQIAAAEVAIKAKEAQGVAAAAALLARTRDLKITVAQLDRELAEFLVEAGSDRPERTEIEAEIDTRRQRDSVIARLAQLDAAVLGSKREVVSSIVADHELAGSFSDLGGQDGLVFASQVTEFKRQGDHAKAVVHLRTAMTSFPETTLIYTYDLVRKPDGWIVTAGHRAE